MAFDKVQPQGLEDIAPAAVTPWTGGIARELGDLFQRTIVPDDVKLSSQSDAYGILKARDLVVAGGATHIQLLRRTGAQAYAIDETIDLSDCDNLRLQGMGCSRSGETATTLVWTGAAGGTVLKVDGVAQTEGLVIGGFDIDGAGLALRCLDTRSVVSASLADMRLFGATQWQWFLDVGTSGLNSQTLTARHLFLDAYTQPGSGGMKIGAGSATNDTCASWINDIQIQFLNGVGFDAGSADSITFSDLKIYRFVGGTGKALICRAGTNGAGFNNWFQGNTFTNFEPRALDGSVTNFVEVETGTRDPENNRFGMLDQSGPQYPTFANATVLAKNTITSEQGYRLEKGLWRSDRSGYQTFGGNYDEGAVPVTISQVGTRMLRLMNPAAPADAKRWDVIQDGSGHLIFRTRDDSGANGGLAFVLQRSAADVSQAQVFIGGNEKLRVSATGLTAFGLGDYANDAAAAAGGVPVSGLYHNAGALRIRLV